MAFLGAAYFYVKYARLAQGVLSNVELFVALLQASSRSRSRWMLYYEEPRAAVLSAPSAHYSSPINDGG